MKLDLQGRHALVCGASAGIGKAAAMELAALGANVTLLARNAATLQTALDQLDTRQGQRHRFLVCDLSDATNIGLQVASLLSESPVHILVNNAGGPPGGPITQAAEQDFMQALQRHLFANQQLAQLVLPGMKASGFGRIINIISTSVKEPLDGLGVSNTTRWAVAGWAKTWANEVGPFGITVNNVLPGYTSTGRLEEIIEKRASTQQMTKEAVETLFKSHVPARRFAAPEEIAAAIAFLATPAASYINGINLPVDGGRTKSL